MLLTPKEYDSVNIFDEELQQLLEKLILYNQGKKYGQIAFVVGGAASGKGFAISNFMEKEKFKIRDIDEWKKAFIVLDQLHRKTKGARGLKTGAADLKLSKSKDVATLHALVKSLDVKGKTLVNLLMNAKSPATLPNILFDITGKDLSDITDVLPDLLAVGYNPKNIHVTWVLTNYSVAVERNKNRERVVPADILFSTHVGAAATMSQIVRGKIPRGVNGAVRVVLNNKENTIPFVRDGRPIKDPNTGDILVKDFTYVTLKKEGRRFLKEKDVQKQLYHWIVNNVPEDALKIIPEPEL